MDCEAAGSPALNPVTVGPGTERGALELEPHFTRRPRAFLAALGTRPGKTAFTGGILL